LVSKVKFSSATAIYRPHFPHGLVKFFLLFCIFQLFSIAIFAHPEISTSEDQTTLIVNDAPEQDIIAFGKSIIIKKRAKSALAVGGDITIEGDVLEDVATIGGNVVQKDQTHVGGDVFVFGGSYKQEGENALREPGKETVTVGAFEEELRNFGQNPSHLFSPSLSLSFFAQRLLVALLWFLVSIVLITVAPGAISRSVARMQLSLLKICALGAVAFISISALIIVGLVVLPNYLGATLSIMGILVLLLSYVFGRVSLQVSVGKLFQKHLLSESNRSETLAILIGVLVWTLLLSMPYIWLLALFAVFIVGIGLILTGRASTKWTTP
jgi:hypothetical protein